MARLFISLSSRNSDKAVEVRDRFAKNSWDDVFIGLDSERGIAAWQRRKDGFKKAALRCEPGIAQVSKKWLASRHCTAVVDAALLIG